MRLEGNVIERVRSVLFYAMLIWSTIALGLVAVWFATVTRKQKWPHRCARIWGMVNLVAAGVRVRLSGLDRIDLNRAYIFAANHQGWFDIFSILAKLPVHFSWLAKEELFRLPVLGPAMAATGYIPIDRTDHRKALESMNHAAMRVKNGTSIVIFPEGTRSPDGVLQGFKKGGIMLSIKSQQPIVPVTISGSHAILPKKGDWVIHPGRIDITIGNPIPTEGCSMKDRDWLMAEVRQAIRKFLRVREGGLLPDASPVLGPGENQMEVRG